MRGLSAGMIAVIFTSRRTARDAAGYAAAAAEMEAAAARMPGYLGICSARDGDGDGFGITVSYWRDETAAAAWRDHLRHAEIRAEGRARWYTDYEVVITEVQRSYTWKA